MIPSILSKFEELTLKFVFYIQVSSDLLGGPSAAIEGGVTAHPIRAGSQVNVIVLRPTGQVLDKDIQFIVYLYLYTCQCKWCTHKWSALGACEVSIYQRESVRVVKMSGRHLQTLLHLEI